MINLFEVLTQLVKTNLEVAPIAAYPIVFFAGILFSFTPCLYPVIPIVIAYIGGKQENSRIKILLLSLFYAVGLAFTYAGLGLFAAFSGRLFGQVQTNPFTYIIVANIIIFFGLSALGLFTLPVPVFFQSAKTQRKKIRGFLGAFVFGLASGFVVAPCTIPVLGVLLVYVASQQNLFLGGSLLFTFALGMGLVLILVGSLAGILFTLPKIGQWTIIIKKVLGWAMIVLGQYFLIQAGRFIW